MTQTRANQTDHPANADAYDNFGDAEIPGDQPTMLCAKCHGPHYREWGLDVHGRVNGHWGAEWGEQRKLDCIQCHDPHDPKPPETPRECSACHAEIARTKAISHHVGLECTTCHVAPDEHRVTPRTNRATKPAGRQFCGTCHGEDSEIKGSLKVDLATHGGRYQCWQCHYPHMPEVK